MNIRALKSIQYARPDTYLLDIKVCRDSNAIFAVSASDNSVNVYDLNTQKVTSSISIESDPKASSVSDFVFDNENILFVASKESNGGAVMKDLRMDGFAAVFKGSYKKINKLNIVGYPATCLSVNSDNTFLAVGTVYQDNETSIKFWSLFLFI